MIVISETAQTILIAILLVIIFLGWIVSFGWVAMHLDRLARLVSTKRQTRKFFKTVERCRRDFA